MSRLLEQNGVYYFFEHASGSHTMVLADSISGHQPMAGTSSKGGAGTIRYIDVTSGEYIREQTPVVTIVQVNPLKLKTAIQEKHASLIRPGQMIEFNVEAFMNRKFEGKNRLREPGRRPDDADLRG